MNMHKVTMSILALRAQPELLDPTDPNLVAIVKALALLEVTGQFDKRAAVVGSIELAYAAGRLRERTIQMGEKDE